MSSTPGNGSENHQEYNDLSLYYKWSTMTYHYTTSVCGLGCN